jgi:hypothetical protein
MSVRIEGLVGTGDWIVGEVVHEMNHVVDGITDEALNASPVRSGLFKASWRTKHARTIKDTAEVENDAPHAIYVEARSAVLSNAIESVRGDE